MNPFKILLVGLGNRGNMWADVIAARQDAVIAAAVDPGPAAQDRFRSKFPGAPLFDRIEDALDRGGYDGVVLVTPPEGHLAQSKLIFQAGLPLLAEKPLTVDLPEAVEIVQAADAAGLPLMVGLNFRYLPVSQKIRALVQAETFGKPGFGIYFYPRNRDGQRPGLNKYPLTMLHPMMLEQSIHHLDLIRYCYGREVERIACRTWNPAWSMYAHDSNVTALLTLEGGMEVTYYGTWTGGWNGFEFQWRTDCERGIILQRQLFEDLWTAGTADEALTHVPLPEFRAFYDDTDALLTRFIAHLRDGAELECSGRDHLITLALCFAGIESSETGQSVDMAEFCRRYGIRPSP